MGRGRIRGGDSAHNHLGMFAVVKLLDELLPNSITFSVFSREIGRPSVTVGRDGEIRPDEPNLRVCRVNVLLEGDDESIDVTAKQYKSMLQLVHLALDLNPCAIVTFQCGASPWGRRLLNGREQWMSVRDSMALRPVHVAKVYMRKRPRHHILRSRNKKPA